MTGAPSLPLFLQSSDDLGSVYFQSVLGSSECFSDTGCPSFYSALSNSECVDYMGRSYFHPVLSNSECISETLHVNCANGCPGPFVASYSCCVFYQKQINKHTPSLNNSSIEIRAIDHFCCGSKICPSMTVAATLMPQSLWYKFLSIIWLWSSPVFRLAVYTSWVFLEQCKLLSACGVAF